MLSKISMVKISKKITVGIIKLSLPNVDSVNDGEEFLHDNQLRSGDNKMVSVPGFVQVSLDNKNLICRQWINK